MRTGIRTPAHDDRGVTLVELVVTVALIGVVGAGMAAMLMSIWGGQSAATSVTAATTRGSMVAGNIERAVRNAEAFQITDSGDTLRVRTTLGGELTCQGFTVAGGDLRMAQSAGALPADWPIWHEGIAPGAFAERSGAVEFTLDFTPAGASVALEGTVSPRAPHGGGAPCW